jgi:hypothetical protein
MDAEPEITKVSKLPGIWIHSGDAFARTDPDITFSILGQTINKIMWKRTGISVCMIPFLKTDPIVPVEAKVSAYPHKALPVLKDAANILVREALPEVDLFKRKVWLCRYGYNQQKEGKK